MKKLVGFAAAMFIRTLHATLRVRHIHPEKLEQVPHYIIAFWHEFLLVMLHSRFRRPICVMSSRSRDGEIIAQAFHWYGVDVVRGSSTHGGTAVLRALIVKAKKGKNVVFTPDGPIGPRRIAKAGIVRAAQSAGIPIVPIAYAAKRKKHLASWDRMLVPWPFTRFVYLYGDPISVPRDGDVEEWRLRIEQALNAVADAVEGDFEELWKEAAA